MTDDARASALPATGQGDGRGAHGDAHGGDDDHVHGAIHLPPNSWCPIGLALGLTALFVGFLAGVWLMIIGGVWTAGTIAVWVRGARAEYLGLPE